MDYIDCERCKLILDIAAEGFWDWNLKANQAYLSPRYCELIGYSPDVFDREFLKQVIHPDDHMHFFSVIDEHLQGKRAISVTEYRMISKDGSLRWIEGRVKLVEYDEQGKPSRMVGTIVDITDRKLTESDLRDNNRLLSEVIDNSGMLVAVKSLEGRYEIVNRRWEEITGMSRNEVLGKSDEEIFPYPIGKQFRLNDLEAMESGHCIEKEEMIDDEIRGRLYGLSTKFALKNQDGSFRGLCVMSIDITARKRAELRLQRSEEEFRLTFEGASDAIFWAGAITGILINCNGAAAKMLEMPREEIIGKHQAWLHPPEMADHFAAQFKSTVAMSDQVTDVEAIVISKSGKRIPVHIKPAVTNVGGRDIIQGVFRDISELRQAEEEKLALERQFRQAQKLESLGIMAGGIAHDFNNLLQSILGNMELASMRLASDSVAQKYISSAMNSGRHASHLTNLMLTYVGQGIITKKPLNLNELVRENIEMLKTAASTAVSIKLRLSAEQPVILADEAQILQVVMNLLTNAAESIGEQPGIIKLTTRIRNCDQPFLATSLLNEKPKPGYYLILEVSDNGCGMSEETVSRLFDPFFTTKFTGRGLGMSAVMGILRAHHGALFVESKVGKGSTFRVLLPITESAHSDTVQESIQPPQDKNASTANPLSGVVLVVDDEKSVLKVCAKMVKLCGFSVITAHDGIDAVAKFREHAEEIVVVLMDLTMPNMDGIAAMCEIYGIRPDMKVILASGFNEKELSDRITCQPPSGFISKPYSYKVLVETFRRVVQGELR
jgi:two-component system cell cycle sensor histidine kinase/response regulator CckA